MRRVIPKIGSAFFYNAILFLFIAISLSACKKDDNRAPGREKLQFETEKYSIPTEDELTIKSDLPAYVFDYEYQGFGAALVNRLQNRAELTDELAISDLASVVLHSSQIGVFDDWGVILVQLLTGRNIIIIEPTVKEFNDFCDMITTFYFLLMSIEGGEELLDALDVVTGARQTLEAFYEISTDSSKLESMFLLDTDTDGIFAEAIAVRGSNFHIVDRMSGVAESDIYHEQIVDDEGTTEEVDTPEIESSTGAAPSNVITPYTYGRFADMFTKWINEQKYYVENEEAMRRRGANLFNTRASETSKLSLEDISTVQKVQYTISASTPYDVGPKLPVTVSFEICSIYMEDTNCDYYCVYKNILSYNQLLDCGPTGEDNNRKWRESYNFGEPRDDIMEDVYAEVKGWYSYPYYGPFMRDIESRNICHAHTGNFVDSATTAVELPDAQSIKGVANVAVDKYSPKNSIGSIDKTDGFSVGFDGGLFLAKDPGVNVGFSVSYDTSTSQTIDDLDIIASTASGVPEWKYVGKNLPEAYYNLFKPTSHSEAPSIMRRECEVDQSWIWKVPNPTGSYRLFDETKVTTSIMYYNIGFFEAFAKYANHTTTKRVSFLMMPPPRCSQLWMMNVSPYSDELNSMLASTHNRFWKKDNHEFNLSDTSEDSRISIEQFLNDFQRDLNSKRHTWKNRKFTGTFTFSYYNINDEENEPITFDFVVE